MRQYLLIEKSRILRYRIEKLYNINKEIYEVELVSQ